jgi:hypothetical protein
VYRLQLAVAILDLLDRADRENLLAGAGGEEDDRRVEELLDLERVGVLERGEGAADVRCRSTSSRTRSSRGSARSISKSLTPSSPAGPGPSWLVFQG